MIIATFLKKSAQSKERVSVATMLELCTSSGELHHHAHPPCARHVDAAGHMVTLLAFECENYTKSNDSTFIQNTFLVRRAQRKKAN